MCTRSKFLSMISSFATQDQGGDLLISIMSPYFYSVTFSTTFFVCSFSEPNKPSMLEAIGLSSAMRHLKPKLWIIFVLCGILVLFAYRNETNESQTIFIPDNTSSRDDKSHSEFQALLSQATSGQEFSGMPFRTFPPDMHRFQDQEYVSTAAAVKGQKSKVVTSFATKCRKWGVVTTIFAPQEAVRRFLYRQDWCIIVVGDKDRPKVSMPKNF